MARYHLQVCVLVFNNNGIYGGKFEGEPGSAFPKVRTLYTYKSMCVYLCFRGVDACVHLSVYISMPFLSLPPPHTAAYASVHAELTKPTLPPSHHQYHHNTITTKQDPAPTAFVPDARYDLLATAFGGLGLHVATPEELDEALDKVGRVGWIGRLVFPFSYVLSFCVVLILPPSSLANNDRPLPTRASR